MSLTTSDTLQVPGASLYYKVCGSDPLLLILQGGDGDADGSDNLADHLVDYYTVVTYDRRGLSRSKLDEPLEPYAWRPTVTTPIACWPRSPPNRRWCLVPASVPSSDSTWWPIIPNKCIRLSRTRLPLR